MPDPEEPAGQSSETAWQKQRRLEAVFGDVLPDTTNDERDDAVRATDEDAGDRWLKSQVPPHHA